MKAQDIFGLAVRLLSVVLLLLGIWYLAYFIAQACGLPEASPGEMTAYFVVGILQILTGLMILRFAQQIVRFSYREESDNSAPTS